MFIGLLKRYQNHLQSQYSSLPSFASHVCFLPSLFPPKPPVYPLHPSREEIQTILTSYKMNSNIFWKTTSPLTMVSTSFIAFSPPYSFSLTSFPFSSHYLLHPEFDTILWVFGELQRNFLFSHDSFARYLISSGCLYEYNASAILFQKYLKNMPIFSASHHEHNQRRILLYRAFPNHRVFSSFLLSFIRHSLLSLMFLGKWIEFDQGDQRKDYSDFGKKGGADWGGRLGDQWFYGLCWVWYWWK